MPVGLCLWLRCAAVLSTSRIRNYFSRLSQPEKKFWFFHFGHTELSFVFAIKVHHGLLGTPATGKKRSLEMTKAAINKKSLFKNESPSCHF
jgi:hypothetical protein